MAGLLAALHHHSTTVIYPHLLAFHNAIRWIIIVAGLLSVLAAASGWNGNKAASPMLRRAGLVFVAAMDTQLLVGLLLYFAVSPLTRMAFQNLAAAMKDHELRFFTVEHTSYMLIAVVLAHIGAVRVRRAQTDRSKHRSATIAYSLSILLILAGIPWWRPLFRWAG